jgi:hypothetical protein
VALVVAVVASPGGSHPTEAQTTPPPCHDGIDISCGFPLDLAARDDLAPVELDLGSARTDGQARDSGFGRLVLDLNVPRDPVPGVDLGPLEHPPDWIVPGDRAEWPSPDTMLERHLAIELDRILTGQPWGRVPAAIMFDAVAIAEAVGGMVRRWRDARLPPAARLPRDGSAVVRIREATGPPPDTISVVPLVDGWVGETVHGVCDAAGTCEVTDLPSAPSTLLVIGRGGAVVAYPGERTVLDVTLRPLGRLSLDPVRPDAEIRIRDAASELVVPVVRWLNAGRGEWLELDDEGVLYLPEGRYLIETRAGMVRTVRAVRVDAEVTTELELP